MAPAASADFLAMVVSTGVGGGIVLDGRLLDGADGNAGHIGHVVVVPGGRVCACGGRGCLEAEASGTAIAGRAPARPRPRRRSRSVARAGRLVGSGRGDRSRRCSTSASRWWRARWPWASATTSSRPPRQELDRTARIEFARGADDPARPAWAPTARWSVPAAVAWRALGHQILAADAGDPAAVASPAMDPTYPPEADAYREKVQAFLAEHLPADWKGTGALDQGAGRGVHDAVAGHAPRPRLPRVLVADRVRRARASRPWSR